MNRIWFPNAPHGSLNADDRSQLALGYKILPRTALPVKRIWFLNKPSGEVGFDDRAQIAVGYNITLPPSVPSGSGTYKKPIKIRRSYSYSDILRDDNELLEIMAMFLEVNRQGGQ